MSLILPLFFNGGRPLLGIYFLKVGRHQTFGTMGIPIIQRVLSKLRCRKEERSEPKPGEKDVEEDCENKQKDDHHLHHLVRANGLTRLVPHQLQF